jgi:tripartite-type tricarboxylate transporter receptor subunit TctC
MRAVAHLIAAAIALVAALPAGAQDTSKPITMVVPFPAGGSTDVIGRVIADGLRQVLGQTVVVENRAGAGGSIGTAAIAKAAPDGSVIGMGTASTLAINPATYKTLPFDVLTDLAPIGNIAAVPNIMSIHPGVPAADMASFIKLALAKPRQLSFASAGIGSVSHLLGAQFNLATGADIVHIPYRGVGPALNDAVSGQVHVMYDNLPTSLQIVRDGRLRALGVSGAKRAASLPDVPTFAELNLADMNWMAFFGLIAPKGTPEPVVKRLNEALLKVLAMPDVRGKLDAQQAIVIGNSPAQFGAEIARELARMRKAAAAAKIELN